MLYMEDFLELIEPFPQEIRERLTEMREIDLRVQNESDKLDTRVETFFQACKKQKPELRLENLEDIKKEYGKLLDNSDEKIQIANQLYDLIEKYIKKLDQELHRFKLELEADHAGITSKLEQVLTTTPAAASDGLSVAGVNMLTGGLSGLDYDSFSFNNPSDESDFTLCPSSTSDLMLMMLNPSLQQQQSLTGGELTSVQKRKLSDKNSSSTINLLNAMNSRDDDESNSSWTTSSSHVPLQSAGGGHVFAMPLSANKKSQMSQKRSSTSMSASTSAAVANKGSSDLLLSLLQSPANNTLGNLSQTVRRPSTSKSSGNKRKRDQLKGRSRLNDYDFDDESLSANMVDDEEEESNLDYQSDETSEEMAVESVGAKAATQFKRTGGGDADDLMTSDEDEDLKTSSNKIKMKNRSQPKDDSGEETNERYCICKDVSYGNMIACDNSNCSTQWFHFTCVGLSSAPKGKWFCPNCTEIKKKRRERHLSTMLQGSSHTVMSPLATTTSHGGSSSLSSAAGAIEFHTPNVSQFITPQEP